ncbi:MAG: glucosyltransferase domain-containing protein, partial [Bacteroidales bacterium]|nr:glucosyltransferase domain-containing protein [Bacteroidales bacterium]
MFNFCKQNSSSQSTLLCSGNAQTSSALLTLLKQNALLICTVVFTTLLTYGFMLFNPVIGVDTEGAMSTYRTDVSPFDIATGRWGAAFLTMFWRILPYNMYLAIFSSLCFLGIGALLWCYVFDSACSGFGADNSTTNGSAMGNVAGSPASVTCGFTANSSGMLLFSILYITSPVWNELMYFHPSTFFFSTMLCPITVLLLFKGFLRSRFWLVAAGVLLFAFMFS